MGVGIAGVMGLMFVCCLMCSAGDGCSRSLSICLFG